MVGTVRRWALGAAACLTVALFGVAGVAAAGSGAEIIDDDPADWTPDVLDGQVEAIAQIGNRIIIGGEFTQIEDGAGVAERTSIAAFDADTGVVDTGFAPTLDGDIRAVVPAGDGSSVFIAGDFNTVNGTLERKVAKLDTESGELVAGFDTPLLLNEVRDLRVAGDELIIAGEFSAVGTEPRTALASLDATTGVLTSTIDLEFAGTHNGGTTLISKIEITPNQARLLVIGNFTSVDGATRDQVALIDLTSSDATLADWYTPFFESRCANAFSTYMRDLDIDASGTFAVISTTGAFRGGIEAGVSCDTISRWDLTRSGTDLVAEWVAYTGGDTTYAVEIGPGVVYAGGHMRWVNNPYAGDYAGPGAIPRKGIVALDTDTGLPFSWDPGRARGVGVFDMLLTDVGLWAGSDTDRWGGETHRKLALFPTAGGSVVGLPATGRLPNHVDALGREASPGVPDAAVLYRINAGGPTITSADDGPDWEADTTSTSPYRNSGSNTAGWSTVRFIDASVPSRDFDRVPVSVFSSERWDPASGSEMAWTFPVASGTPIEVRLFFANRCRCTDEPLDRVFSVDLDGSRVINDLDLVDLHGHDTAVMYAFDVVSDGSVDITLRHVVENPLINGIEIIRTDTTGDGAIDWRDDVTRRYLDPAIAPDPPAVSPGTEAWRWARGGFMIDTTVYTGWADGTILERNRDAGSWSSPTRVDLYGNTLMPLLPRVTGMFYDSIDERVYYTVEGDSSLYWRSFAHESRSVGATAWEASGAIGALDPTRVRGMFLADGWIYFADDASGDLMRIAFDAGTVGGAATLVDDSEDWRSRALVLSSNVAPHAVIAADCTYRACVFDGSSSFDSDGAIVAYDWDFGDGQEASGDVVSHTYAEPGSVVATLTVTDDEGAVDVATVELEPAAAPVHLHDLKPAPYDVDGDKWVARVIVKVRDTMGDQIEGVVVTAEFGAGKVRTCTTNQYGKCKVKIKAADTRPKMPVEVRDLQWQGGWDSTADRDTDGDGDGATTLIWRPF